MYRHLNHKCEKCKRKVISESYGSNPFHRTPFYRVYCDMCLNPFLLCSFCLDDKEIHYHNKDDKQKEYSVCEICNRDKKIEICLNTIKTEIASDVKNQICF